MYLKSSSKKDNSNEYTCTLHLKGQIKKNVAIGTKLK